MAWLSFLSRSKGALTVLLPLAMLGAVALAWVVYDRVETRLDLLAAEGERVRSQLWTVRTLLVELDTAQQNFGQSGDAAWLQRYRAAALALGPAVADLQTGLEPFEAGDPARLGALLAALPDPAAPPPAATDRPVLAQAVEELTSVGSDFTRRFAGRQGDLQQAQRRVFAGVIGFALIGLMGGFLAGARLTFLVRRRLGRLEENARRLQQGLAPLPVACTDDEIGRLGRGLEEAGALLLAREQELEEVKGFLEHLITIGPVMMFRLHPANMSLTYVSPNIERLLGYAPAAVVGMADFLSEYIHPAERAAFDAAYRQSVQQRASTMEGEYRLLHRDGHYRWFYIMARYEYAVDGQPLQVLGYGMDITDRREVARAQQEQTRLVRLLQEVAVAANEAGSVEEALQTCLERIGDYTGWPVGHAYVMDRPGEFAPTHIWRLPGPETFQAFRHITEATRFRAGVGLIGRAMVSGKPEWIKDVREDSGFIRARQGVEIEVRCAFAVPVLVGPDVLAVLEFYNTEPEDPDVALLTVMAQVGTQLGRVIERKKAVEALRQSEERFARAFRSSPLPTAISTLAEGRFIDFNDRFHEHLGYDRAALIGRTSLELGLWADLADRQRLLQGLTDQGAVRNMAFRYRTSQGELRDALMSAELVEVDNQRCMLTVMQDVTDQLRQEEDLRQAKAEAERANQAKSQFLSRMSHELRTPMNAILGFAQLMEMDELTPENREGLAHIMKAGRHLLNLINEVLDIARIESGRMALSPEPLRIGEVVAETLDLVSPLAAARDIQVQGAACVLSNDYVMADLQRLKQVLLNLLSNAVKYNREGGLVTISCSRTDESRLRLTVTDTGWGIAGDKLERLFTPFDRLGAEQSGVEGTGLGLALARGMVEAMGGSIGVDSAPGQGSTFWIELQRTADPIQAVVAEEAAAAVALPPPRVRTVLYIEDNPANLQLVQRILVRAGYHAKMLTAMQGGLGLELARNHRPDLILLDLQLPDISGRQVLERLQADPRTHSIPVVVVTADATSHHQEELRAAGAREYLTKPLDVARFLQVVGAFLQDGGGY